MKYKALFQSPMTTLVHKDCCECEKHLDCAYEARWYRGFGFFCGFHRLSMRLLATLAMNPLEITLKGADIYIG